jgi:NDP-sugar pyrophosphorylase family protein
MKAMILAAGMGTRLRPLTNKTPKSLILVNERPLIHYQIALLRHYGVTEIAVNLHHLGSLIESELGDGNSLGVRITYSMEDEILGTGGGIKKMTPFFEGNDFWIVNADVLIDCNLEDLSKQHQKHKALATMVLRNHPDRAHSTLSSTALFMNKKKKIYKSLSAGELCSEDNPYLFTGVHLVNPELLKRLPHGPSCIFKDAYRGAIEEKKPIYAYPYDGYWADLGTMESYQQAERDLSEGHAKLSYL